VSVDYKSVSTLSENTGATEMGCFSLSSPVGRTPAARADVASALRSGSGAGIVLPSTLCCVFCKLGDEPHGSHSSEGAAEQHLVQHKWKGRYFGVVSVSLPRGSCSP